jgi:hypothetical protein
MIRQLTLSRTWWTCAKIGWGAVFVKSAIWADVEYHQRRVGKRANAIGHAAENPARASTWPPIPQGKGALTTIIADGKAQVANICCGGSWVFCD